MAVAKREGACVISPFRTPAEYGAVCKGDFIVSVGARGVGSVYQIVAATKTRSEMNSNQWKLDCIRCPDMVGRVRLVDGFPFISRCGDSKVWDLHWDSRNRKSVGTRS